MAGRLLAAMAPSFVFRHVGGRHGGARAQPLFGNAMQILVAEDDSRVAEHIAKGLKTAGQDVSLVRDGRACFRRSEAHAYDLIVVCRVMPSVDGLTLLQSLSATTDDNPLRGRHYTGEDNYQIP